MIFKHSWTAHPAPSLGKYRHGCCFAEDWIQYQCAVAMSVKTVDYDRQHLQLNSQLWHLTRKYLTYQFQPSRDRNIKNPCGDERNAFLLRSAISELFFWAAAECPTSLGEEAKEVAETSCFLNPFLYHRTPRPPPLHRCRWVLWQDCNPCGWSIASFRWTVILSAPCQMNGVWAY